MGPAIQHRQRGGRDPPNAFHTSGNAQRAWGTTWRRHRLASTIVLPRRCAARRRASSIVVGMRAGRRSKNSPARESNAASIGSDLFLPANAKRNRAEWRLPTSDSSTPAFRRAIDNGNHVIDVGSATATAPGRDTSRWVNRSIPANVGGTTKSIDHGPGPAGLGPSHDDVMVRYHRRVDPDRHHRTTSMMVIRRPTLSLGRARRLLVPRARRRATRVMNGRALERAHPRRHEAPDATRPNTPAVHEGSPALVGHPMPRTRRPAPAARTGPIHSLNRVHSEQDPSDDLFHEPEAQPKCVTAETLPRYHPTWPPAQDERLTAVTQPPITVHGSTRGGEHLGDHRGSPR